MSKNITELCTLLVEKEHGELASDVFSTVAHVGRQHLAGLIRASSLSAKQFRHGLATLLQHQLVLQYDSDESAYYEVSWEHAHNLARIGKITRLVEGRYGKEAGEIIITLLLSGHAKVSDLTAAYGMSNKKAETSAEANRFNGSTVLNGTKPDDPGTNGHSAAINGKQTKAKAANSKEANTDDSAGDGGEVGSIENINGMKLANTEIIANGSGNAVKSSGQLHSLLYRLLKAGWIIPVYERDFWPASDQLLEAEAWVIDTHFERGKIPKGPKQTVALKTHLKHRMRQLRDRSLDFSSSSIKTGSKRPATDHAMPPSKRARTNGVNGTSHSGAPLEGDEILLDDDLVVRVSLEKVSVAMRTEQLVRLAHRFIGETTSKVYRAFLQLLEEQIPRCYDVFKADPDPDSGEILIIDAKVSVMKIAEVLDSSIDLYDGLAPTTEGIPWNTNQDELNLRTRAQLIEKHIKILADDSRHLATWGSSRGMSEWYVEFPRLARYLIQNQIEEIVQARFERLGMRLVRLLHSRGKLDEKQVANMSMSQPKITRPILSQMQEAGFLDLQEVPKDNSRHPSRTIYLWFYDQDRVRRLLLEDSYKAMARILQRIDIEREKVLEIIEKAERTDVKGKEDKYLTKAERQTLRDWSQAEAKLFIQMERVDDLVSILKEFLGPPRAEKRSEKKRAADRADEAEEI